MRTSVLRCVEGVFNYVISERVKGSHSADRYHDVYHEAQKAEDGVGSRAY